MGGTLERCSAVIICLVRAYFSQAEKHLHHSLMPIVGSTSMGCLTVIIRLVRANLVSFEKYFHHSFMFIVSSSLDGY